MQVDAFLLAGHLNLLSEPLRSGSTFPACFAEVPMFPQVAPLGKNLRELLTNSPHHVTLKYYKIKQLNMLPMEGLKLLPKLHPLVCLCQLLTSASPFLRFSSMSQTHSRDIY